MKVVLRGSSLLAKLLGEGKGRASADQPAVLSPGSAGGVHIGMPAAQVKTRRKDISCEIENGVVHAICVHSRRYKTDAGIGVGDSAIALANQYTIRWTGDHTAEVDELKMRFQIEQDRIVSIVIS